MTPSRLHSVALLLAALVTADPSPPPIDPLPQPVPSAVVDRQVRDPAIIESSGLAISPTHPGVLWTMNDSGHAPVLYAVGRTGATVATVRLTGVPNLDWEAMAAWRDGAGRAMLAVADIGDNAARRTEIEIDVLSEPARLGDARLPVQRRIRLRYPDGAADAEALLVDPRTQRMYVVTKGLLRARVLAVPEQAYPGTATTMATLEPVGAVGIQLATDGTVLPSGQVLLRSYGALMLLAPLPLPLPGAAPTAVRPLGTVNLPAQRQGEGLAATESTIYLSSEGVARAILRMPMPPSFVAAPAPTAAPTPTLASPQPGGGGSAGGRAADDAEPTRALAVLSLVGLAGGFGLLGVVLVRRRAARPRQRT